MPYYLEGFELEQFNAVITHFRTHILRGKEEDQLPVEFQTDEEEVFHLGIQLFGSKRKKRVFYQYNQTSFLPHIWQSKQAPNSPVPIRNAIQAICAYQSSRAARMLGSGHLYDPTNLVCEQLKSWLARLSRMDLSDGQSLLAEVGQYITYIKSLEQSNIFPASKSGVRHQRSMSSTLLEVSEFLGKFSQEIIDSMGKRSLRDVVNQVAKSSANAADSMIQYLFYILRSNKTPAAISVKDIQQVSRLDLLVLKDSRSFKLLKCLVESPCVQAMNYEKAGCDDHTFVFSNEPVLHIRSSFENGKIFNSEAARRNHPINQIIGGHLIPDRNGMRRWWGNVHSGISGYFQSQEAVMSHFVKLHALVEKVALFCLICRDLEDLVDFFGSKIWAEMGSRILAHFQESYRRLCNDIRLNLESLHGVASERYRHLTQSAKHQKTWLQNYNTADRIKSTLSGELEYTSMQMGQINGIVDRLRSPSKDEEIRRKLSTVVTSLNRFGSFFSLEPISAIENKPVSSGYNLLANSNI